MNKITTNLISYNEQNHFSYSLKTIVADNNIILCISAAVLFFLPESSSSMERLFTPEKLESVISNNFGTDVLWDLGMPKGSAEFLASGAAYSSKILDELDVLIKVGTASKQISVARSKTPGVLGFEQAKFAGTQPDLSNTIDFNTAQIIIPEHVTPANFNTAPIDQRLDNFFNGNEEIEIRNMHQLLPVINSSLPGIRPRFFVVQENAEKQDVFREMVVQNDTLWLLPNVECGILIYRATCPIANNKASDIKCIYSAIEELKNEAKLSEYYMQQMLLAIKQAQETTGNLTSDYLADNSSASYEDNSHITEKTSSIDTNEASPVKNDSVDNITATHIDEEKIILDVIAKIQQGNDSTLSEAEKQYKPLFDKLNELMTQFKLNEGGIKDFLEERKNAGLSLYPSEEEIIENFKEVWEKDPELEKSLKEKMSAFKKIKETQLEQLRKRMAS